MTNRSFANNDDFLQVLLLNPIRNTKLEKFFKANKGSVFSKLSKIR